MDTYISTRHITREPGTDGSPAHHFTPLLRHQAAPGGKCGGRRGDGSLRLRALHARRLGDHLPVAGLTTCAAEAHG